MTVLAALAVVTVATVHDGGAQERDRFPRYTFTVELDGVPAGSFQEVSGIGVETEVVEFREGSSNVIRKLPGLTKYPNIVLKRGFTGNTQLFDWATTRSDAGDVLRRSVSIILMNAAGAEVARWNFQRAWIAKWQGPTLSASSNDVAVETIELAHEGLSIRRD